MRRNSQDSCDQPDGLSTSEWRRNGFELGRNRCYCDSAPLGNQNLSRLTIRIDLKPYGNRGRAGQIRCRRYYGSRLNTTWWRNHHMEDAEQKVSVPISQTVPSLRFPCPSM